ncbi:MAG: DUF2092 domain-containing protein [Planctomycetota bacterium]
MKTSDVMKNINVRAILVVLALFLLVFTVTTSSADEDGEKQEQIDPRSEQVLAAMGQHLGGLKQFAFTADVSYDSTTESGQLIEMNERHSVAVKRPGQLRATVLGKNGIRLAIINNKMLTLYDRNSGKYFQAGVPADLDGAIDSLVIDLGMSLPSADFVYADPASVMKAQVKSSTYLGVTLLKEQPCHHLAFKQDGLHWQLWVSAGAHPVPVRITMQYIKRAGSPRFSADLAWETNGMTFSDLAFTFIPDDSAVQVKTVKELGFEEVSE